MTEITLSKSEAATGSLPKVCMISGAPADLWVEHTFRWWPIVQVGTGFSLLLEIVLFFLSKKMRVRVPLAARHKHVFRNERLAKYGGSLVLVVVVGLLLLMWITMISRHGIGGLVDSGSMMSLVAVSAFLFIVTLAGFMAAYVLLALRVPRPLEITNDEISLVNVSDHFAAALAQQRGQHVPPTQRAAAAGPQRSLPRARPLPRQQGPAPAAQPQAGGLPQIAPQQQQRERRLRQRHYSKQAKIITILLIAVTCLGGCVFSVISFSASALFHAKDSALFHAKDAGKPAQNRPPVQPRKAERPPPRRPRVANPPAREPTDVATALAALQSGQVQQQQQGIAWLTSAAVEPNSQQAVVRALAAALQSENPGIRNQALAALQTWATPQAAADVAQAAADKRVNAVEALQLLGRLGDASVAPTVIAFLDYPFAEGQQAEETFTRLSPAVHEDLIAHFNDPLDRLRQRVRKILAETGADAAAIVEQCAADLASRDEKVRRVSVEWLMNAPVMAEEQAAVSQALAPLTATDDAATRRRVLTALLTWGDADAVEVLVQGLKAKELDFRRGVEKLAMHPSAEVAATLCALLDHAFEGQRVEEALQGMPQVAEAEVVKLVNDPRGRARQRARRLLAEYKTDPALILKQSMLDFASEEPPRRALALEYFVTAEIVEPQREAVAELIQPLLADTEAKNRGQLSKAFCRWAGEEHKAQLEMLLAEKRKEIYLPALRRMVVLDSRRAAVALSRLFQEFFPRGDSVRLLRSMGAEAEDAVLILLTDKNEGTIAEACKVLKDIGTDKSLQPLTTLGRRATVAKKPKIAKAAQQAIEAIQARK